MRQLKCEQAAEDRRRIQGILKAMPELNLQDYRVRVQFTPHPGKVRCRSRPARIRAGRERGHYFLAVLPRDWLANVWEQGLALAPLNHPWFTGHRHLILSASPCPLEKVPEGCDGAWVVRAADIQTGNWPAWNFVLVRLGHMLALAHTAGDAAEALRREALQALTGEVPIPF